MNEPRHRLEKGDKRPAPSSPIAPEEPVDEVSIEAETARTGGSSSPDAAGQDLAPQTEDEIDRANSHD
jgi:hypothetical protein